MGRNHLLLALLSVCRLALPVPSSSLSQESSEHPVEVLHRQCARHSGGSLVSAREGSVSRANARGATGIARRRAAKRSRPCCGESRQAAFAWHTPPEANHQSRHLLPNARLRFRCWGGPTAAESQRKDAKAIRNLATNRSRSVIRSLVSPLTADSAGLPSSATSSSWFGPQICGVRSVRSFPYSNIEQIMLRLLRHRGTK